MGRLPYLIVLVAALLLPAGAGAGEQPYGAAVKLFASVGPEFTISFVDAQGQPVTKLPVGTYEIEIDDRSDFHSFHITGPGVDVATEVVFVGKKTVTVTFRDGVYKFMCDPHPNDLHGAFTVGTGIAARPPVVPVTGTRLVATVGPEFTISLRTPTGKPVRAVRGGVLYTILVRDRSRIHNFHLRGPGVNRTTGVLFTGNVTWKLRFLKGKVYSFRCDPHLISLKGSFRSI